MDKKTILAHVALIPADKLLDFVNQGTVTLAELQATGDLDSMKRKRIAELQQKTDKEDNEAWNHACFGTELDLRNYISKFPAGKYVQEAKDKIRQLEVAVSAAAAAREGVLKKIRKNSNEYSQSDIIGFLQNGTITTDDLLNCGIPQHIIDVLHKDASEIILKDTPYELPKGHTEIYFWGIPGSGKTCALAAILNAADKHRNLALAPAPSYGYMTRLTNLFEDKNAILPKPTKIETTQYLPFTIQKGKDKLRSVSLIELSGEIFECFFHMYDNEGIGLSPQHQDTFNKLVNNFLKSKNRKMHFFFIDYNQGNVQINGIRQSNYLDAAKIFFEQNDIFNKATDAIYVVVTKSDLMPNCNSYEERVECAKSFLEEKFNAFIGTLKEKCRRYEINGKKLLVEPFSLGDVYFQRICDFDDSAALRILDIFNDRIQTSEKSVFDIFNK